MHLARFPRARFAHLPTPLEPLPRLGAELGIDLWVKRDDCTGLAGRRQQDPQAGVPAGRGPGPGRRHPGHPGRGPVQPRAPDHRRRRRFGLACEIILEERTGSKAGDYIGNGNVLLDRLMGAAIRFVPGGTDMIAELEASAAAVGQRGGKPYVIPGGGSNTIGALGYVDCALELVVQADDLDLRIDRLVTATGSAGTHAGLVAGLAALRRRHPDPRLRRPRAQGQAGGQRLQPGGRHGRDDRRGRTGDARDGGGRLRLCRRGLRPDRPGRDRRPGTWRRPHRGPCCWTRSIPARR